MTKAINPLHLLPEKADKANWQFPVPEGYDLLICRIIARNAPGQRRRTTPVARTCQPHFNYWKHSFYHQSVVEKTVTFPREVHRTQIPTALDLRGNRQSRFWYAVRALHLPCRFPQQTTILSWFTAYVSNTIASSLAQSIHVSSRWFAQWKAQGETAETLQSEAAAKQICSNSCFWETPGYWKQPARPNKTTAHPAVWQQPEPAATRSGHKPFTGTAKRDGGWSWFKGMKHLSLPSIS